MSSAAACVALVVSFFAACDRAPRTASDSGVVGASTSVANDSVRPPVGTGWEPAAGPFIVLPSIDGGFDAGSVLRADASDSTVSDITGLPVNGSSTMLELFTRASVIGEASLTIEKPTGLDSGCTAWPVARLNIGGAGVKLTPGSGVVGGSSAKGSWTAAFVKGKVVLIPLDSIEGLTPRDSAILAANVARVASTLVDDTVATFRGLPFIVLGAYRGTLAEQSFVVATLVRRVNQEDAPKEERLVMVIDGDKSSPASWTASWWERAAGKEDELVVSEPLMAFHLPGSTQPHLLFGRDDGEALSAATLVREGGSWKVQWESALAGCDR